MKFFERGRSMVEILGVLAVIGVLSVAGMWGYRVAINKNTANEILRELNMRANQVAIQLISGKEPDLSQFGLVFVNSDIYEFSVSKEPGSEQFKIAITQGRISDEVCRQIFAQLGNESLVRAIGQETVNYISEDSCEGQKDREALYFTFNDDLSKD